MIRNKKLQEIDLSLNSLVVFRKLMTQEVILPLRGLLDTETTDPVIQLRLYTEFISRLYSQSMNLTDYIFRLICEDENFYIAAKARGEETDPLLDSCVENELIILQRLARLKPHELQKEVSYYGVLPEWKTSDINFYEAYMERIQNIGRYGFGRFARNPVFVFRDEHCVPVQNYDKVTLNEILGCEEQKQIMLQNTNALLEGNPAQNVLLYGDSGTGKSMMVKAIVNEFFDQGLRMIQITKEQLVFLPEIMEQTARNPLKFIIFIDDFSTSVNDPDFGSIKSILEGCAIKKPKNTVIYATSPYYRIIRHTDEAELARNDETANNHEAQENLESVAARFGLKIQFSASDRNDYLNTVHMIAKEMKLNLDEKELLAEAYQYAVTNGFSPRSAKQFILMKKNNI